MASEQAKKISSILYVLLGEQVSEESEIVKRLEEILHQQAVHILSTQPAPRMIIETKGEAKVLLEMATRQQKQLERQLQAARALLEDFLACPALMMVGANCPYCDDYAPNDGLPGRHPHEHSPDCPMMQARAFLADKEQTDGK